MERCQYCLSDKYKDVILHMKTCPHKKRHLKDLKLGVKPIGYATCDECSKLAYTRWYSGSGTKYEKVEHTVCKEHDEAFQKQSKEQRERLGL
jgi:hypothetical protein